jgi:hypothetical protein
MEFFCLTFHKKLNIVDLTSEAWSQSNICT